MPSWEEQRDHFISSSTGYAKYLIEGFETRVDSPIEKIVFIAIYHLLQEFGHRNIGIATQKQILNYRVDFLIQHTPFVLDYKQINKVVIECDGHEFHEKTKKQVSKDKKRDRELQKLGYVVLRYSGSDLYKNGWEIVKNDLTDLFDPAMAEEMRTR